MRPSPRGGSACPRRRAKRRCSAPSAMFVSNGTPTERAAHAATADRRHAREHGVLEVVRGGVGARRRQGPSRFSSVMSGGATSRARAALPSPSTRSRAAFPARAGQLGEVAHHRRLASPLAGADDGDDRAVEVDPLVAGRLERLGCRLVGEAQVERERRKSQLTQAHGEDRLVGELHDGCPHSGRAAAARPRAARPGRTRRRSGERAGRPVRAADLSPPHQTARRGEPGDRIAHYRRVVLAVEQDDHPGWARQPCVVSPRRVGSFSYSYVHGSNERIGSRSWNGYLRKTVTRPRLASITL